MKKMSLLLVIALIATMLAVPAFAEGMTYTEAPMLAEKVANGELPPVEERLPNEPLVVAAGVESYEEYFTDYQIGQYGGTLRSVRNSATWDGWIWCIMVERGVATVSGEWKDFYGAIFDTWEVSEDFTHYDFHIREGVRWSDGELLTTEDVQWKYDMELVNAKLNATFPNWLRVGNSASGIPASLTVIDDYSFSYDFESPYPGFLLMLTEQDVYGMLAPAHYLKDFHIDTADEAELTAKCEKDGYTLDEWFKLYGLYDYTTWDVAAENQVGCPSLSAWILERMDGSTGIFTRNPYYWKVDAIGQQLPYCDAMTSTYCVDQQAIAVKIIGGEVDYTYEWIPLNEVGLYAGSQEEGDYRVLTKPILHRTGADLVINWTYDDANWREVCANYDFRKALALAVDCDEIADSVYYGFAIPAEDYTITEYNPEEAKALLDGIGMTVGADGYRTYPNGDPCSIELAYSTWMTTYEPTAVLMAEFLRDIDLNIQMKFVDNDLMDTLDQSNDLQMSISFSHGPAQVISTDYAVGKNARQWWNYYLYNGESGEEPNEIFSEWYNNQLFATSQVGAEEAAAAKDVQIQYFKDNLLYIMPVQNVTQPSAISNRLMNFPSEGGYNLFDCRNGADLWVKY